MRRKNIHVCHKKIIYYLAKILLQVRTGFHSAAPVDHNISMRQHGPTGWMNSKVNNDLKFDINDHINKASSSKNKKQRVQEVHLQKTRNKESKKFSSSPIMKKGFSGWKTPKRMATKPKMMAKKKSLLMTKKRIDIKRQATHATHSHKG